MMTSIIIGQSQRDKETREPDDAISITSGSEEGREKRPAMDLARGLSSTTWRVMAYEEKKREEYRIKPWPIPRPLVSSFTAIACVCQWRGSPEKALTPAGHTY